MPYRNIRLHPLLKYLGSVTPDNSETVKFLVSIYFEECKRYLGLMQNFSNQDKWNDILLLSHNLIFIADLINREGLSQKIITLNDEIKISGPYETKFSLVCQISSIIEEENKKIEMSLINMCRQNDN